MPLVDEFAARLFGELDYVQEGRSAEKFARLYRCGSTPARPPPRAAQASQQARLGVQTPTAGPPAS